MTYRIATVGLHMGHGSLTTINIAGEGYIMGVTLRSGIGVSDVISLHYLAQEDGFGGTPITKECNIIVLETGMSIDEYQIDGYVPVDVVKSDRRTYGVFAKFI